MTRGSAVSPTASLRWRTAVFTLSAPRPLLIFRRPPEMTRVFSPTRHGIPLLAIAMVSFAGWSIAAKHDPRVVAPPPIAAPTNPYEDNVAGTGIVEPASEVIALAIERVGLVTRISVVAGDRVTAGQPLFAIDDRNYRAAVAQDEAAVAASEASITTIEQSLIQQRNTIDQTRATLHSAKAERLRASLDQTRYAELARDTWAPRQRLETADADAQKAQASVASAKAAFAGAQQQIEILSAQRKAAEAKLGQARATLEQARVDIDETETWRIRPDHTALARLRGNPEISAPLSFVRFEPYVLPKRSLTGDTTERVDTRVLQALYEFNPSEFPAFVGQQVDVFIAAPSRAAATRSPTSGQIAFSAVADARMQIAGGINRPLVAREAKQPSQ